MLLEQPSGKKLNILGFEDSLGLSGFLSNLAADKELPSSLPFGEGVAIQEGVPIGDIDSNAVPIDGSDGIALSLESLLDNPGLVGKYFICQL